MGQGEWGVGMEGSRGRGYIHSAMIRVVVLQKPIQHCKAIILQLKSKFLKRELEQRYQQ